MSVREEFVVGDFTGCDLSQAPLAELRKIVAARDAEVWQLSADVYKLIQRLEILQTRYENLSINLDLVTIPAKGDS